MLALTDCALTDNLAHKNGGGIENVGGTAVVTGCTFATNTG
jgi:hypothetical protein